MPTITIDGKAVEVEAGKRLVLAIEEQGINIGHRCGGNAKCTTCRVEFLAGEPSTMTQAEFAKLKQKGYWGQARLACQIVCDHDMSVHPLVTLESEPTWTDTGPALEPTVQPQAEWFAIDQLEAAASQQ